MKIYLRMYRLFISCVDRFFLKRIFKRKIYSKTREHVISNTSRSKEKYYIVRVPYPYYGVMAAATSMLNIATYCDKHGYIPIVDWGFQADFMDGVPSEWNVWEEVFENKVIAQEAYQKGNVIAGGVGELLPISQFFYNHLPNNSKHRDEIQIRLIEEGYKDYYREWNTLAKKYWIMKKEIRDSIDAEWGSYLDSDKRILAVLFREEFTEEGHINECDMAKKAIELHPLMPDIDTTIEIVKKRMNDWKCDYVFVSAELETTIDRCKREFGKKLLYLQRPRKMDIKSEWLGTNVREWPVDIEARAVKDNVMKWDRIVLVDTMVSYLKEIQIMSRCTSYIGAITNGTRGVLVLNGGKFENIQLLKDYNDKSCYK